MSILSQDTQDPKIQNKTLTEEPLSKVQDQEEPRYMVKLELSEEQKKRILEEIKEEFDEIKREREERRLEKKWETLERQYEGLASQDQIRQFNLCRRVTKVKCDSVERLIMKAAWKAQPKFSVSARPEFEREGGREVCEAQEDFLDYKLDEDIPFMEPERKAIHSAVVKGTGILKITHEVKIERKKREELYKGNPQPVMVRGQNGIPIQAVQNGQPLFKNEGLEEFLKCHPGAETTNPGLVKKLSEGKEVLLVVEYDELVYNDPLPKFVDLKNFYVRCATEGYDGLKTTQLTVERLEYTYWELKRKENAKKFYDIDALIYEDGKEPAPGREGTKRKNYAQEKYKVLECVFYFKMRGQDEETEKLILWIAEDKWKVIGSIRYPYYAVPCCYIPHYIASIHEGFYQPGIAEYLTDNNIAENAILNFTLEGAMTANIITPIAPPNNPIHAQFLDKRWTHGVPLEANPGELRFLGEFMPKFQSQQLLQLLEYLGREDGDISGVNQLINGQESLLDPTAPAAKTIALLRQSGINVEDYIDALMPAFARIADTVLQLYYQMSKEGLRYRVRPERVVGSNPFAVLSRSDMIARTNIQSQAKAFNFDEANEKREDLALFQVVRQEPLVARNPEAVYFLLKSLVKGWSKKWRNQVEQILPPLREFQQKQQEVVAQGVAQYIEQKLKDAKLTGQAPEIDPAQLMAVMSDLMSEQATPAAPEVQKEREKKMREQNAA